jgi:hypothetical protein
LRFISFGLRRAADELLIQQSFYFVLERLFVAITRHPQIPYVHFNVGNSSVRQYLPHGESRRSSQW